MLIAADSTGGAVIFWLLVGGVVWFVMHRRNNRRREAWEALNNSAPGTKRTVVVSAKHAVAVQAEYEQANWTLTDQQVGQGGWGVTLWPIPFGGTRQPWITLTFKKN